MSVESGAGSFVHERLSDEAAPRADIPRQTLSEQAETLSSWAARLDLADIPPSVIEDARRAVLDISGVTFAGSATDIGRAGRRRAVEAFRSGPCSIAGTSVRLVPRGAAFANSTAAHALDFDDTSYAGLAHPSAVVFPAALAAAEDAGRTGGDLLVGIVAGIEVELRLALLMTNDVYYRGWWTTGLLGAIGAAAAAARVYGLSPKEIASALSLAAGGAAGLRRCIGSPAKRLYAGYTAETGVRAAQFVAGEHIDIPDMFDGADGFVGMFGDGRATGLALDGLGTSFALSTSGLAFKTYPVCSAAQAALQAVDDLLRSYELRGDKVAKIECAVSPLVIESLRFDAPQTVEQAQFSMPFAVGCLLAFGRLTPDLLREDVLHDLRLRGAMTRVSMVLTEEAGDPNALEGAAVTVTCTDGRVLSRRRDFARGTPTDPMEWDDLERKFRACASATLTREQVDLRIAAIQRLESLPSCDHLLDSGR